jgi:hypothetical protein
MSGCCWTGEKKRLYRSDQRPSFMSAPKSSQARRLSRGAESAVFTTLRATPLCGRAAGDEYGV